MACLQYLYLDDHCQELHIQLLKKIEEDAQISGFKSIFAIVNENNKSFYINQGYHKEININEDRLTEILGCQIDYDSILLKQFNGSEPND